LVDDSDFFAINEHDDFCVFVGAAYSDVVHFACESEGDDAGRVDFVVTDS
jgi:hypothetical protein